MQVHKKFTFQGGRGDQKSAAKGRESNKNGGEGEKGARGGGARIGRKDGDARRRRDAKRRALAEKPNDKEIPRVFSVEGHIDGEDFVPVRFGLKYSATGKAMLYVVVDQNKIPVRNIEKNKKTEVLTTADPHKVGTSAARSAAYSISQIVPFVNSKDLLRYLLYCSKRNLKMVLWSASTLFLMANAVWGFRPCIWMVLTTKKGCQNPADEYNPQPYVRNESRSTFYG